MGISSEKKNNIQTHNYSLIQYVLIECLLENVCQAVDEVIQIQGGTKQDSKC